MNTIHKLLAVLMALMSGAASAAITITDQSQLSTDGFAPLVYAPRSIAQTFTVSTDGSLVGLDLLLDSYTDQNAQLTVSITSTFGVLPNSGNVLWTNSYTNFATNTGATPGQWISIDTSAGAPVLSAGTVYAIVLTSTDAASGGSDNMFLANQTGNLYSGGALFENRGSGWQTITTGPSFIAQPNADLSFQTHMSVIPEPSTASALFGAVGILLLIRRRS